MRDLMEACSDLGFQVIGFDEEGTFEMRPVEKILGPTGVQMVEFREDEARVWCHYSLKNTDDYFTVSTELGDRIARWIAWRKPGLIQNVFPELTTEQREMMISGITPEEWADIFASVED